MANWLTDLLNPFAGPIGGAPSLRCIAAGVAVAGFALWRQSRTPTPAGGQRPAPAVEDSGDRPLVCVAGDDR